MDGIKHAVFTDKSIQLLLKNPYTSNVESRSTRTKIKHLVELFFGAKVIAINSHRCLGKCRRLGPLMGHTMHNVRSLCFNQVILFHLLERKKLKSKYLIAWRYIYTKLLPRAHAKEP